MQYINTWFSKLNSTKSAQAIKLREIIQIIFKN